VVDHNGWREDPSLARVITREIAVDVAESRHLDTDVAEIRDLDETTIRLGRD
jgi:hypothetical protein